MQNQSSITSLAVNSVLLQVRQWGTGEDWCVLLHGFGEGAYVWNRFAPHIADGFRTIAIDLRGHGDSSWAPNGEYDIENYVADIIAVIDTLQIQRFALVGHSLGGEIAIRIAARFPEKAIGLVIVDSGPDVSSEGAATVLTDFNSSVRRWNALSEYGAWLQERRPLVDSDTMDGLSVGALRAHADGGYYLKCDPALGMKEVKKKNGALLWEMLASIALPVLVLRGVGSAVLSRQVAEEMERILPNGCLRTISGAGHSVMTDNPKEFADVLYPFLLKVRTGLSGLKLVDEQFQTTRQDCKAFAE